MGLKNGHQNNQTLTIGFEKLIMELIDHWWASQLKNQKMILICAFNL